MKTLVLFGRSPFINQVDAAAIASHYETAAINQAPCRVDYLFSLFDDFPANDPSTIVFGHWQRDTPAGATKLSLQPSREPLLTNESRGGFPLVGIFAFSATAALNWAILQGYERVYLVGIDHVESDTCFHHWDGSDSPNTRLQPCAHQDLKQFVYACAAHIEIYQTNPAVSDAWEIPFAAIDQLYSPPA